MQVCHHLRKFSYLIVISRLVVLYNLVFRRIVKIQTLHWDKELSTAIKTRIDSGDVWHRVTV